jgi:hypothetical protein
MSTTSQKVLKTLERIKENDNIYYQEVSDLLDFCLESISFDPLNTDIALTYIVNYGFLDLIDIAFKRGISLLNQLFAPLNKDSHTSAVISKTVFDNIADRMTKTTEGKIKRGKSKYDIYSMAVILEVSETDFQAILRELFTYSRRNSRFQSEFEIIRRNFKPKHIPRLLKMLKECYTVNVFLLIWAILDEVHFEMVTEFIWTGLFDVRRAWYRSERLRVRNAIQLRVVKEICRRCELKVIEMAKAESKVFKCLFFTDYDKQFSESNEQVRAEIKKISEIQRKVAFSGMVELSRDGPLTYNEALEGAVSYIIKCSSRCYRNEMINIAFNNPKSAPIGSLVTFFFRLIPRDCVLEIVA